MNEHSRWYVDLVVVAVATGVCGAGIATGVDGYPRLVLAAPLVLFLPGYAIVAALFPGKTSRHALTPFDEPAGSSLGTVDELEGGTGLGAEGRIALSVLCSIAVLPLVALGVDLVGVGIRPDPVLAGVVGTTAVALALAAVARLRQDPADRVGGGFGLPTVFFSADRHRVRAAAIPNLLLILGVVLLSASVGYAAVQSPSSAEFTEFYVETENMTIDTQTMYPETFPAGERSTLDVYVGNHEGSYTGYTVIAELQRVGDNGTGPVTERQRIATRDVGVRAGETKRAGFAFTPEISGDNLRIMLYLYRTHYPEDPSSSSAYRTLRLDVTVE